MHSHVSITNSNISWEVILILKELGSLCSHHYSLLLLVIQPYLIQVTSLIFTGTCALLIVVTEDHAAAIRKKNKFTLPV